MAYRVLNAHDAEWRPSNQMGVMNADLAQPLGAKTLGARLWGVEPGQASTRHRRIDSAELYVLLEGTGRMRVDGDLVTLEPFNAVLVEPDSARQFFNDTDAPQLWLIVGAPLERFTPQDLTQDQLASIYPDGPKALPPELGGT